MVFEDMHVHSQFSDGRGTVRQNLEAARCAGLQRLGCVDHVRQDTEWVPQFVHHVRSVARDYDIEVVVGVEAKILGEYGAVDAPAFLPGVDRVYIADHQFPVGDGVMKPQLVRRAVRRGEVAPQHIIDVLIRATAQAVRHCPQSAVIAHLFSILPKVGISEDQVELARLAPIIDAALDRGAWIELDERWKCPGPRVARCFAEAGVPVVMSTDAHTSEAIGQYFWAPTVLSDLRAAA